MLQRQLSSCDMSVLAKKFCCGDKILSSYDRCMKFSWFEFVRHERKTFYLFFSYSLNYLPSACAQLPPPPLALRVFLFEFLNNGVKFIVIFRSDTCFPLNQAHVWSRAYFSPLSYSPPDGNLFPIEQSLSPSYHRYGPGILYHSWPFIQIHHFHPSSGLSLLGRR